MIFPISNQVFWTYIAVPVWQREPPPAACADTAPSGGPETAGGEGSPPPAPEPRLVFKGYEWRPIAHWDPFVNPGFDHWVDNDADEMRERQLRAERERQQEQTVQPSRRAAAEPPDLPLHPEASDPSHG